jgi:hypothetical protein
LEATCRIPFEGDAQLFALSTPAGSSLRQVRGEVERGDLMLRAEAEPGEVGWLPTLFAAEIMVIEQHLSAQADVIRQYNADLIDRVRALVEWFYPALDPTYIRGLHDQFPGLLKQPQFARLAWMHLLSAASKKAGSAMVDREA